MRGPAPNTPYEVSCTRCRVTFPVGTRTCIHCGQPIARSSAEAAALAQRAGGAAGADDPLEEFPVRALKASPLTLLWLLAGAAAIAFRACSSSP
jgi:ribosomal protein L37E